jgi:predicted nucleic acid-binding protein
VVIVDSAIWVDYLRGAMTLQTDWLNLHAGRQRLGLTDLILCEVLQGVRDDAQFAEVRRTLLHFDVLTMGGTALALNTAENYRTLRARGRTVRRAIDCLIATFCLMHDHELLHDDRDFDAFEQVLGLRVVAV